MLAGAVLLDAPTGLLAAALLVAGPAFGGMIWYVEHFGAPVPPCVPLSTVAPPGISTPEELAGSLRSTIQGSSWRYHHATITIRNLGVGVEVMIARAPLLAGGTVPSRQYFYASYGACMRAAYPEWRP